DSWEGTTSRDNTVRRWAADLQNDFRARLEWCVRDFAHANHPPRPSLSGAPAKAIRGGETVALDARGSRDPDGQALQFAWSFYPEAGSYRGPLPALEGATTPRMRFTAP